MLSQTPEQVRMAFFFNRLEAAVDLLVQCLVITLKQLQPIPLLHLAQPAR